jgi:hypothetical protein
MDIHGTEYVTAFGEDTFAGKGDVQELRLCE